MGSRIVCVVPTIRAVSFQEFQSSWNYLFNKHQITLIVVWDGEKPVLEIVDYPSRKNRIFPDILSLEPWASHHDLFCRMTDACRNIGFVEAARMSSDYILTLDDDVRPIRGMDPIQEHIDTLQRRVPLEWMNTAQHDDPYLRGVPYTIRDRYPVMLSHGIWRGVPDLDGETQLRMEGEPAGVPSVLDYYRGPIPFGCHFPMCGMNVMVRKEALPYFYFAPMGVDSGVDNLHRFADIWCGVYLKERFDHFGWACYTGSAMVLHPRASNAQVNFEKEKRGRLWNEVITEPQSMDRILPQEEIREYREYIRSYRDKRSRYTKWLMEIQNPDLQPNTHHDSSRTTVSPR